MMGGTASRDGNLACIVVIDRIIVVIYLIRKSSSNLNRQLYANGTSFLLKIKKKICLSNFDHRQCVCSL